MIYNNKFVILAVSLLAIVACERTWYTTSYIYGYFAIDNMSIATNEIDCEGVAYNELALNVSQYHCLCSVEDSDQELFLHYSKLHNDTDYKEHYILHASYSRVSGEDISAVSIVCKDDWDEGHTAGSSLADITTFVALSLYPFIQNGYIGYQYGPTDDFPLMKALYPIMEQWGERDVYPIYKKVSEIKKQDLSLIRRNTDDYIHLFLPKRQSASKCTVEITIKDTSGKTFVLNADVI